jgi:hypothetical protein
MSLEIHAKRKSEIDETAYNRTFEALVAQGEGVFQSKQKAPAKVIGDWQSTETLYAVVNRDAFDAWRLAVQGWIRDFFEDADALMYGFDELCRFPSFVEFLEGQKFVQALVKNDAAKETLSCSKDKETP